jgi:hypothetical protein
VVTFRVLWDSFWFFVRNFGSLRVGIVLFSARNTWTVCGEFVVRVWIFDGDRAASESGAELGGGFAVAEEAEGAEIVEVALASAFSYGADMVRIP